MPRIPRLYEVKASYRNGDVEVRHYQTPKAADERRERFEAGRPARFNEVEMAKLGDGMLPLDVPTVTVTPSHPITYPHPTGDLGKLEIPDAILSRHGLDLIAEALGVEPSSLMRAEFADEEITVTYQPDPTGKREPKVWRVEIV